ncbi:META domain-containing protein [Nocardioides sp. GXZ039]|uniref:META domain-containing protein n=1 Tax=Nocardioides sp. GXZ039 TaxID=3136018 RepID=UPI0030F49333
MTEKNLIDLLERAADRTPIGSPPVTAMLERHRRSRRRRVALAAAGAVAAVAATGVGVAVWAPSGDGSSFADGNTLTSAPDQASEPAGGPDEVTSLEGAWRVVALVGSGGRSVLSDAGRDALRLTFDADSVKGTTECNRLGGEYTLVGENLRFEGLESTLVGCDESPLFDRLAKVRHVSVTDGQVYLHAANWMILVVLEPSS